MKNIKERIKNLLNDELYNLSVIERKTEISRHLMKKIIKGESVPQYIWITLDNFFNEVHKK